MLAREESFLLVIEAERQRVDTSLFLMYSPEPLLSDQINGHLLPSPALGRIWRNLDGTQKCRCLKKQQSGSYSLLGLFHRGAESQMVPINDTLKVINGFNLTCLP